MIALPRLMESGIPPLVLTAARACTVETRVESPAGGAEARDCDSPPHAAANRAIQTNERIGPRDMRCVVSTPACRGSLKRCVPPDLLAAPLKCWQRSDLAVVVRTARSRGAGSGRLPALAGSAVRALCSCDRGSPSKPAFPSRHQFAHAFEAHSSSWSRAS